MDKLTLDDLGRVTPRTDDLVKEAAKALRAGERIDAEFYVWVEDLVPHGDEGLHSERYMTLRDDARRGGLRRGEVLEKKSFEWAVSLKKARTMCLYEHFVTKEIKLIEMFDDPNSPIDNREIARVLRRTQDLAELAWKRLERLSAHYPMLCEHREIWSLQRDLDEKRF